MAALIRQLYMGDKGKSKVKHFLKIKAVMKTGTSGRGYSKLGKLIKKKLIDNNMTAAELAHALGTSPQYLNLIIHGERSGEKYLEEIKRILKINAA